MSVAMVEECSPEIAGRFDQHVGYSTMFREGHLTLGAFFPLEAYSGSVPRMDLHEQIENAKLAEAGGFASLFVRDVPLLDPSFGDVGQIFDPWAFLGFVAGQTSQIALGAGSVIATLRHPLHLAKAAASVDRLSNQRFVLGLATGDRPVEFEAFGVDILDKGRLFRDSVSVMRDVWGSGAAYPQNCPSLPSGVGFLPYPLCSNIPILVTGRSSQSLDWISANGDGWLYYPRNVADQAATIVDWRRRTGVFKPFAQSLYIDLATDADEGPTAIHLGFRSGHRFLRQFLDSLRAIGVNHVILNLKYGRRPARDVIAELAETVVPHFSVLDRV